MNIIFEWEPPNFLSAGAFYLSPSGEIYFWLAEDYDPETAFKGYDLKLFSIQEGAIGFSVHSFIQSLLPQLSSLEANSEGKFSWETKAWAEQIDTLQIAYFYEPQEWLEQMLAEIKERWQEGLPALTKEDCRDAIGNFCDYDAALKWLQPWLEEWEEERRVNSSDADE
jgi:hypothetical protein